MGIYRYANRLLRKNVRIMLSQEQCAIRRILTKMIIQPIEKVSFNTLLYLFNYTISVLKLIIKSDMSHSIFLKRVVLYRAL